MKKLFTLLLTACMLFAIAGCSSNNESEETGEPVKVTIWHTYTEAQKECLEKAANDFNASQDKYVIDVQNQEYSGFSNTVYQAVYGGNGPDIIIDYASTAAVYVEDNKVADIQNYLNKDLVATMDAGAYEEATSFSDGKMHVFPIVLSGPVLFYNPNILAAAGVEVPTTWDELAVASKKISETVTVKSKDDGTHEFVTDGSGEKVYGFAVDSPTDVAQTMIMQLGVTIFDTNANSCAFDTESVNAALKMYQDGVVGDYFLANPTLSNYFSDNYNTGTLGMYVGSVAGAPYLNESWDVAYVPQTEGGKQWTPAWNRGVIVFNYDDEERVKGACAFIEYFASPEVNAEWCVACNYQTCLSGTREVQAYKDLLANSTTLNALQPEIAGSFQALPAIQYVRDALKTLMQEVGAGVDVKQAIANAYSYVAGELE